MPGLGRKVFTAGDVLTASDVQNFLMDQTVMNFAGTAARSSAIATPTDGMVTYNQTNDSLEAYNGAAWVNVSGLQLIKRQAITAGVSSVTITNVFNTNFDNYKIIVSNFTGNIAVSLSFRLGTASTAYYYSNVAAAASYATANGTSNYANGSNATSYEPLIICGTTSSEVAGGTFELQNPFLATSTAIQSTASDTRTTGLGPRIGSGYHATAASYTDCTFLVSGATISSGNVAVYGYAK